MVRQSGYFSIEGEIYIFAVAGLINAERLLID